MVSIGPMEEYLKKMPIILAVNIQTPSIEKKKLMLNVYQMSSQLI